MQHTGQRITQQRSERTPSSGLHVPQQVQLFNQAGLLPLQTLGDPVHFPGGKRQQVAGEVGLYT